MDLERTISELNGRVSNDVKEGGRQKMMSAWGKHELINRVQISFFRAVRSLSQSVHATTFPLPPSIGGCNRRTLKGCIVLHDAVLPSLLRLLDCVLSRIEQQA